MFNIYSNDQFVQSYAQEKRAMELAQVTARKERGKLVKVVVSPSKDAKYEPGIIAAFKYPLAAKKR